MYTWEEFKAEKPTFSIGLDGIVNAPTMRDPNGPYANFDHHAQVDRLITRSSAEQVHMEINMGLFDRFRKEGIPHMNVYINDPDEDTCLAYWLLKNHEQVVNHANPLINRLVYCEDRLDCTAGAYPFGDTAFRRQMAWIFEPYNDIRFRGKIPVLDAAEMRNIVEAVGGRIKSYIFEEGGELALEGNYEKIGGGEGWTMTKETGPASRMAMYNDGIKAYIALVAEKEDGSHVYVAGRRSVWTPFNLPGLFAHLNEIEKEIVSPSNMWAGSDTVGGSPRGTGSMLTPDKLQEHVITYLTNHP